MRLGQTLILILLPLLVLSQTPSIDLDRETVTLNKDQVIELAKIVRNEQRLGSFVDSLRADLIVLHDSIAIFTRNAGRQLAALRELQRERDTIYEELVQLQEDRKQAPKGPQGLYLFLSPSTELGGRISTSFGGILVDRRLIYGIGVDPFRFEKPVYLATIGIKIF